MKYKSNTNPLKMSRKDAVIMRKFTNACWVMHENGMATHERHNIFCDCVTEAQNLRADLTPEQKAKANLKAQDIFVKKVIRDYPEWFEGKVL